MCRTCFERAPQQRPPPRPRAGKAASVSAPFSPRPGGRPMTPTIFDLFEPFACAPHSCVPRHTCGRRRPFSPPPPKPFVTIQAADMAYQVEGVSITPAELEADSRWIRHCLNAACLAPIQDPYSTASHHPQHYHSPSSRSPPSSPSRGLQDRFQTGRGLDLRTTTNGALLQILCTLATIDYATACTADRVRINPYNNSLTISTPSQPRARLYLRVSELRLGPTSYPLRAYMAAPDNALRGIIYNAVDSQTQDEIVQDLQAMNVNTPYAIADARQMGGARTLSSSPSSALQHSPVPSSSTAGSTAATRSARKPRPALTAGLPATARTCARSPNPPSVTAAARLKRQSSPRPAGTHVTGSRPCKLRFDRNGPSSPPATSKPQPPPPAPPTRPIHKTSRPSRRRSPSRGARSASRHRSVSFPPLPRSEASTAPTTTSPVSWKSQPHTSDPQTAALKATIAAQQLQIQELSRQLQAALARLSSPAPSTPPSPATAPSQTPSQPAPAEEPMNTAPSAASSRASSPTRHPPHKR
ncbi:hypothetical protein HPB49_002807 [Dermacentor silvarum]|uniref:Uncharacterized protein n=1 Tax=Dermacentor silvarum TaxID=543639 RepID=A0ACB8DM97_DERSI|nr:hypothetical protein HPB49_002807 [Dermacentor silvarum]